MIGLLDRRGVAAESFGTAGPDEAGRLARNAITDGTDVIVGYGGDGTLNEIVQGMAGYDCPLAVWSGGTANVVAKDLNMPRSLEKLADVIATGKTRKISLGLASAPGFASPGRYFVMFAGIGLDAAICKGVNPRLKDAIGQAAFWLSGIRYLALWPQENFEFTIDGVKVKSCFALVANGKGYGGGIHLADRAQLEDPSFEVFSIPAGRGRLGSAFDLINCLMGKREKSSASIFKTASLEANSNPKVWVEADGEVVGALPMSFRVVPDALSLIVP